ncbi:MAG: PQQ-dependent sugar dehydrogenase [Rubripirellula sp.]|nr:PQQ-dependent sugar dehydrogenase [Rubripirellula sp.]
MRTKFFAVFLAVVLCLFDAFCFSSLARSEEFDPARFERTTVATNLMRPMELDIAPDGKIFLIELEGEIKLIDPRTSSVDVVGKLTVTTEQENGLIGLALDPKFSENHWLYLQYSPPEFSGQHVSRFTFTDGKVDLSSEKVLFKYQEQRQQCCHHAGSLEFGPDGCLFIGTGDNTNPFNDSQGYAPIDERNDRGPWDAQRTAGNTKNYNGKVLRIRPEADGTYSIPDGNLFPRDGSVGYPEIYVMGCRNPWRINIDQKTGFLYWGDVGPDAGQDGPRGPRGYDEINQARAAGNFGWPYFIGDNFAYGLVDFSTGEIAPAQDAAAPKNRSVNNNGATDLPPAMPALVYYPGSGTEKFPALASGGRTACAGPVYYFDNAPSSSKRFPDVYDRTLFAFEWSRSMVYAVHLDADSNLESVERFLPQMKFSRPVDLQFDQGGSLYIIEYGETWGVNPDAQLVRIDYQRGNRVPVAVANAGNAVGREPLTVEFDATGSSDRDGESLEYRWTAVPAGREEIGREEIEARLIGTDAQTTAIFDEPGVYTVRLEVRDEEGASSEITLPIIVGNSRPVVEFVEPQDGDFFQPGVPIEYKVVVHDYEDGTSDPDESEQDGKHFIEAGASTRVGVEAMPLVLNTGESSDDPGLALIKKSDCLNCHATNRPLVGPSFVQIADKYRGQPHQLDQSVKRVLNGSTGVWGKIGMLPHLQHSPAEVQEMVEYVFSTKAGESYPNARGFRNELLPPEGADRVILEASYVDLGRGQIPKLIGVGSLTLRSRHLQAESADAFAGTRPLGSNNAEGGTFMGAIDHGGFLRFNRVRLDGVARINAKVASAGAGGVIEVRRDRADGALLGQATVKVNGQWEEFYDLQIPLAASEGFQDLFLVFQNEQNRGGLMNVDSISFED